MSINATDLSVDAMLRVFYKEKEHSEYFESLSEDGQNGWKYIATGVFYTSRPELRDRLSHPTKLHQVGESQVETYLQERSVSDKDQETALRLYPTLVQTALTFLQTSLHDLAATVANNLNDGEVKHILSANPTPTRGERSEELSWDKVNDSKTVKIMKKRIGNWTNLSGFTQSTLLSAIRDAIPSDRQV